MDVRIVELEPMRMISAYGFGANHEDLAWEKIKSFAEKRSINLKESSTTTFGFNNTNPSKGSPNYGYEIWLPVKDDIEPDGDLKIVNFNGGFYAVTTFKGLENIGTAWGNLVKWREGSKYINAHHQWLKELLTLDAPTEEFVFNLYLPIDE
jgi:effector-binding domain-containing protein